MNINRRTLFFIINSRITEIGQHHLLFFVTNLLVNVTFYLSKLGPNFVAAAKTKENDHVKTKVLLNNMLKDLNQPVKYRVNKFFFVDPSVPLN